MFGGPGRPLLGPSSRQAAGWPVAGCAVLVAVLGAGFAHQATADPFDRVIDSPVITHLGGHSGLLLGVADIGTQIPAIAVSGVIVVACLLSGRLNGAVLAAAAVPAADVLGELLIKPLVHRTDHGGLSYPSGHATTVMALAATITVLLVMSPSTARTRMPRLLVAAAAWVVACAVAVAVIGLGWHYFTDTVASAALAIGTVRGLALTLDLPATRRWLARVARAARPDG